MNSTNPKSAATSRRLIVPRVKAPRGVDLVTAVRRAGGLGSTDDWIEPPAVEIGERIRATRMALGWTQADLAARVGCAQGDISAIERGRQNNGPTLLTLTRIARALGIEIPINSAAGHVIADVQGTGDVRNVVVDCSVLSGMLSGQEWAQVRTYAREKGEQPAAAAAGPNFCSVVTLGARSTGHVRPREPLVVTLMRGGGRFQFSQERHRRRDNQFVPVSPVAILDAASSMDVTAANTGGVSMAMVPVHMLMRQKAAADALL